jgi:hypothetical protein
MIYKIKKGNHSFGWLKHLYLFITGFLWKPTQITYKVRFTNSCRFDTPKNPDQLNKLFGMSFGILPVYSKGKWYKPHHWNSIRICWDWCEMDNMINLYIYTYKDAIRVQKYIKSININEEIILCVTINNDVVVGNKQYYNSNYKFENTFFGYKLYPYIGGKEPAPQDCEIELIEV